MAIQLQSASIQMNSSHTGVFTLNSKLSASQTVSGRRYKWMLHLLETVVESRDILRNAGDVA